jgi:hypothetical protein
MRLSDKERLIEKLNQNGFRKEKSPAGIIIYVKESSNKYVVFTLSQNVFEKNVIQLTSSNGTSKNVHRYTEVDDVRIN